MVQFARQFSDIEIVSALSSQLSWTHFCELIRIEGEEAPIGLILCATASRRKVELLEMDKAGIAVAEYWTHLPPKDEFEAKINTIIIETKERLARRKSLPSTNIPRQIDYFLEPKDDEET
jgi:hypothetical protein